LSIDFKKNLTRTRVLRFRNPKPGFWHKDPGLQTVGVASQGGRTCQPILPRSFSAYAPGWSWSQTQKIIWLDCFYRFNVSSGYRDHFDKHKRLRRMLMMLVMTGSIRCWWILWTQSWRVVPRSHWTDAIQQQVSFCAFHSSLLVFSPTYRLGQKLNQF